MARNTRNENRSASERRNPDGMFSTTDPSRRLSSSDLREINGGGASGTYGGGNVSIRQWIIGKLYGVEPSYVE